MDIRQLRCFIAVADELHFGKAAERLGLAPPALSRVIKALEDELGVELLVRTTRQVGLTRAGLALLEEAKGVIAKLERAARTVRDAATSSSRLLRIGAIDAASASFLPEIVMAFRAGHPAVDVKFVEAMTGPLVQMLESGRLDICLTRPPKRLSECRFEVLRVELPFVLLPEGHRLSRQPAITMHDLVGEPVVMPSKRARPYAHDLVMTYFETVGSVPKVSIEATEKPAVMSAVAAGLGLALAPDWLQRLSFPGVVMRKLTGALLDPPPTGAQVGVVWRPDQKLAARDAFLALLRERVQLLDDTTIVPFPPTRSADAAPRRLGRKG